MEKRINRDAIVEALFALCLAALFAYAIYAGMFWPYKTALFPTVVGIPGVVLALAVAVFALRRGLHPETKSVEKSAAPTDLFLDESQLTNESLIRTVIIFSWIVGAVVGSWLFGQKIALPLFVFAYLKLGSREGWFLSVVMTLATIALLLGVFDYVINVAWYEGEVFRWLGIDPW